MNNPHNKPDSAAPGSSAAGFYSSKLDSQRQRLRLLYDGFFVAALIAAFIPTYLAVQGLHAPHDPDLYRDIAHAQTIRDGAFLADPYYRGETLWYNPLIPSLVALISWLSEISILDLYTRAGPFLNLATPIAFYVMVTCLFGRPVGWLASVFFIFLGPYRESDWAWATYSPWLLTSNLAPALFFIGVALLLKAGRALNPLWRIGLGVWLGLTFLAHTAPALLLGGLLLLDCARRFLNRAGEAPASRMGRAALADLAVVLLLAFVTAQPFALSILWNYGLTLVNEEVARWDHLALKDVPGHVWANWILAPVTPFALLGMIRATRSKFDPMGLRVLWSWFTLALAFIAYGWMSQWLRGLGWDPPALVPPFHFMRLLHASVAVFAGLGTAAGMQWLAKRVFAGRPGLLHPVWLAVLGLLIGAMAYPRFTTREDMTTSREIALEMDDPRPTVAWLRANTGPDDVFLAPNQLGLWVVGLAGRKVSAVSWRLFSNPYVPWDPRYRDEVAMMSALREGKGGQFRRLATRYAISHLILRPRAVIHPRLKNEFVQLHSTRIATILALRSD